MAFRFAPKRLQKRLRKLRSQNTGQPEIDRINAYLNDINTKIQQAIEKDAQIKQLLNDLNEPFIEIKGTDAGVFLALCHVLDEFTNGKK